MGIWDTSSFGNDDAADWAWQFEEADGLQLIEETLDGVFEEESSDDFIESSTGCEAVAACEVIARMKGFGTPPTVYSEAADKWAAAHPIKPSEEMLAKADAALDLVMSEKSELCECWKESEFFEEWKTNVADLKKRLRS
jgi:Domain of unknown function (DUF4259)